MISFLKKLRDKFYYAIVGCIDGFLQDKSIRLQVVIAIIVVIIGMFLQLHILEWIIVVSMIGFVIALEYINSAIELLVDMVSPTYHPLAKKIKDYAAAAVLVSSITAVILTIFIIIRRFL